MANSRLHTASLDWITPESERIVAAHARVSTKDPDRGEAVRLLRYCIKHGHWSVFEQVCASFEILTTRAISPQLLRHRSFTFQEACITGDSKISFELPSSTKNNRRHFVRTIEYLYTRFYEGASPISHSKNSNITIHMPMRERITNMQIRVYDEETQEFKTSNIVDIYKTGIKPCFEIEFNNGKKIKCTADHKFLTKEGFQRLNDAVGLTLNNKTACFNKNYKNVQFATNGEVAYRNREWLAQKKIECIQNKTGLKGIAEEAGCSTHTVRKWLKKHDLCFTKREVASYTPIWNKGKSYVGHSHSEESIAKLRIKARRGDKSNLWRGGVDRTERLKITDFINAHRKQLLKKFNYSCVRCGAHVDLELHHVKPVYSHPELAFDLDNIEVLCKHCHRVEHKILGHCEEWRAKSKGNTLIARWTTIKSIQFIGEQETYDLEVAHSSHNYVANGIVVHNSQRYCDPLDILEQLSAESPEFELRAQDEKNRQNSFAFDDDHVERQFRERILGLFEQSQELYRDLLDAGVAKECARNALLLCVPTRLHMMGTLRSWIFYVGLRNAPGTQFEHRLIAQAVGQVLGREVPVITEALLEAANTDSNSALEGWKYL